MTTFPVTHSIPSVSALRTDFLSNYDLPEVTEVKLLSPGLNDTYLVTTVDSKKYILRVYRYNWRSRSDIAYEIDILNHLGNKNILVARPIIRTDGQYIGGLLAPEGKRYAVLFQYAPGKEAPYDTDLDTKAFNYGVGAAKIHQATQDFSSNHSRFILNLHHLVETPLRSILPLLAHRPEDIRYLQNLAKLIRDRLEQIQSDQLEQGFCHGDFHGGNANFADDGSITFYDFDSGGWGWRAYDLAVFRWSGRYRKEEEKYWQPFLRGYQQIRKLSDLDMATVPLFMGVRHFLLLGVHTSGGKDWGFGWLNDKYFDHAIEFLQAWEKEYL